MYSRKPLDLESYIASESFDVYCSGPRSTADVNSIKSIKHQGMILKAEQVIISTLDVLKENVDEVKKNQIDHAQQTEQVRQQNRRLRKQNRTSKEEINKLQQKFDKLQQQFDQMLLIQGDMLLKINNIANTPVPSQPDSLLPKEASRNRNTLFRTYNNQDNKQMQTVLPVAQDKSVTTRKRSVSLGN
jgi:hypothetical protein